MRLAQKVVRVSEVRLGHSISQWHTYKISWGELMVRFYVDDAEVLAANHPPIGPLGFVAWIDNQYAIASPDGGVRFGVIPTVQAQTLELKELKIYSG
jgi:beta-glucanase (GH16 family)